MAAGKKCMKWLSFLSMDALIFVSKLRIIETIRMHVHIRVKYAQYNIKLSR